MPKAITYSPVSIEWDLLSSLINQSNHKVKQLKHQVKTRSIDVALAKKQFYPDVQLGVDYIATGESVNPGVSDSGKDPVMVMFSVDIPMWYGKKRAALAEAEHQYHASIADLQNSRNQLNADLKMALFEFQDAERKFKLYQTTLTTLARNSLNVARESYEGGRVEFSELIDAQRLLLEFQLSYERARTDHEISLAKIERILGRKLPQPLQMKGSPKL
jgi:outer membrane protein TolC